MTPGDTREGTPADDASESKGEAKGGGGAGGAGGMKKGPWTAAEDAVLVAYVREHGEGNWNAVQRNTGLSRCGKSCRLRWANHLRPNLKKGSFSPEEERLILQLHAQMGNKWARMATQLPGRTDNEIKNYWNTRIKRRQRAGLPLYPPDIQRQVALHHRPPTSAGPQFPTPMRAAALSLFDPINFSGAGMSATSTAMNPFLLGHPRPFYVQPAAGASHHQRGKRPRDDDMGFSLPPPPPQGSLFQFNPLGNYDLGPPRTSTLQHQQCFSVKTELPSNQLYPDPSAAGGGGGGGVLPLEQSNSELLESLLFDPPAVCSSTADVRAVSGGDYHQRGFLTPQPVSQDVKRVKADSADAHPPGAEPSPGLVLEPLGKWDHFNLPVEAKVKREPAQVIGSVEDDLSALLDSIPMSMIPTAVEPMAAPPDWLTSDSGELSNGQSSAVTDEVGLEMQQLASSLSMAAEQGHCWSIGPCHWGGSPGIR